MHEYIVTKINTDNKKICAKVMADSFDEAYRKAKLFAERDTILSIIFIGMVDFKALA